MSNSCHQIPNICVNLLKESVGWDVLPWNDLYCGSDTEIRPDELWQRPFNSVNHSNVMYRSSGSDAVTIDTAKQQEYGFLS